MSQKKLKSDSNYQSYSKCLGAQYLTQQFHVHDAPSAFYKVVQQHNLDVMWQIQFHLYWTLTALRSEGDFLVKLPLFLLETVLECSADFD